jgi:hypothetical protein
MPAKWQRLNPIQLAIGGKGKNATMLMAVAAKKHVTIFARSRRAPGAGHPSVKAAFSSAAKKTLGISDRSERNAIVASGTRGSGPGVIRKKSRAKAGSPLYGKVYEIRTK